MKLLPYPLIQISVLIHVIIINVNKVNSDHSDVYSNNCTMHMNITLILA
jgi:hypothetical protein